MAPAAELSFAELLSGVAERTPAPGGGSGAAWCGALGAALLEMAAAFAGADAATERASSLRANLLDTGEAELHAYEPVLEAIRLPTGDPARRARLDQALSAASDTPLAIARSAAEVAELAAEITAKLKPGLRGDAIAGVMLAEAATRAARQLIEINLRGRQFDPRLVEARALSDRAARARARALEG